MNSFNPSRYSSEVDLDVSNEVVEKGHKNILKVDLDKFEFLCRKFLEKKDVKIKNLAAEDKEDFDLIVSYVHLLYGTEYYETLYEKVRKYFKNVVGKPGSVAGYFSGCMNKNGSIESGCSLACAGSMPAPENESGWASCDSSVIMGERENGNYVFSIVKPGESTESAYVFVESDSLANFPGFTEYEKQNLKALGCKNVKLVGYSSDMTYSDIYTDTRSVDQIKHRHVKKYSHKKKSDGNGWLWLLLVVLIILFIVFAILTYKYYQN